MCLFWLFLTLFYVIDGEDISLPVLVLVPFPDSRNDSGWDRGLDLLPAARVAVREVNNQTDLLPGYKLELIEASSDACGLSKISKGLENFTRHSLSKSVNPKAIVVIGLVCSSVTADVSCIAGQPEVELLQISMSSLPVTNEKVNYNRLWRILPSSIIFINTTVSLMKELNWTRVSTIFSDLQTLSAEMFRGILQNCDGIVHVLHKGIDSSSTLIEGALHEIQVEGARIIFVSVTVSETAHLLCKASIMNMTWPDYVWIINGHTLSDIIKQRKCGVSIISRALENSLVLNFQLESRSPEDILVSGKTYSQYRNEYLKELREIQTEPFVQPYLSEGYKFEANKYSNPMYDEVWALALALDNSLSDLEYHNLSLKHYQYNMSNVTDIIEKHLLNVKFAGAVNDISFDCNFEPLVPVNIYQVRNSVAINIGVYSKKNNTMKLWNINYSKVPLDEFERKFNLIPPSISNYLLAQAGFCFIGTTITLILMLYYHRLPEVRATSPLLTIIVYVGVYTITLCSLLALMNQSTVIDRQAYTVLCNIKSCFIIGEYLIITTVLFKLVRIFRVFTHFGKTGKLWQDHYLVIAILVIAVVIPLSILVILLSLNPLVHQETIYRVIDKSPPYIGIDRHCSSSYHFIVYCFSTAYNVMLLLGLVVFSILTRKIDREHFKDTKKTLSYVFTIVITNGILIPLIAQSQITHNENGTVIYQVIQQHLSVILAVGFLLAPKVFPLLHNSFCRGVIYPQVRMSLITIRTMDFSFKQ